MRLNRKRTCSGCFTRWPESFPHPVIAGASREPPHPCVPPRAPSLDHWQNCRDCWPAPGHVRPCWRFRAAWPDPSRRIRAVRFRWALCPQLSAQAQRVMQCQRVMPSPRLRNFQANCHPGGWDPTDVFPRVRRLGVHRPCAERPARAGWVLKSDFAWCTDCVRADCCSAWELLWGDNGQCNSRVAIAVPRPERVQSVCWRAGACAL